AQLKVYIFRVFGWMSEKAVKPSNYETTRSAARRDWWCVVDGRVVDMGNGTAGRRRSEALWPTNKVPDIVAGGK
ncbi:hypothetical protein Dimus_035293, partial [Dionaea muscipula]